MLVDVEYRLKIKTRVSFDTMSSLSEMKDNQKAVMDRVLLNMGLEIADGAMEVARSLSPWGYYDSDFEYPIEYSVKEVEL